VVTSAIAQGRPLSSSALALSNSAIAILPSQRRRHPTTARYCCEQVLPEAQGVSKPVGEQETRMCGRAPHDKDEDVDEQGGFK
jgi:hypothetical protein